MGTGGETVNFMKFRIITWHVGYQQTSGYKIVFIKKKSVFNEAQTNTKVNGYPEE